MEDIKLSLDRENTLEFNVDIQGYAHDRPSSEPQVRLFLEQKNMGFCLPAKKDNNSYSIVIPEMKNIMESGVCDARMEIIIDNKYFVPWESQIEFDKEVKVEASPIIKSAPEPSISVQAKPVIKEKINSKPKRKVSTSLIVDNKPKKRNKKESLDVDNIIDDLSLLANKIR